MRDKDYYQEKIENLISSKTYSRDDGDRQDKQIEYFTRRLEHLERMEPMIFVTEEVPSFSDPE